MVQFDKTSAHFGKQEHHSYFPNRLLLSSPSSSVADPAIPPGNQGPLPGCSTVVEGACLPSPCGIKPCGEQLLVLY